MRQNEFNVGGEQSGHIVLSDFRHDGRWPGGRVADPRLRQAAGGARSAKSATALNLCRKSSRMSAFSAGKPLEDNAVSGRPIADAEAELAKSGRLLIRPSGTEPLIRVMAEGDDRAQVERIVNELIGGHRQCAQRRLIAAIVVKPRIVERTGPWAGPFLCLNQKGYW